MFTAYTMKLIYSDIKRNLKLFLQLFYKLPINIAQAYQVSREPKKGGCKNRKKALSKWSTQNSAQKNKQKKDLNKKVNNYKVNFQCALLCV